MRFAINLFVCASLMCLVGCVATHSHPNGHATTTMNQYKDPNTHVMRIAVLSVGDLDGKKIPMQGDVAGGHVTGSDVGEHAVLSKAVRDALNGTQYDTILDATVTTRISRFWFFWYSSSTVKITVSGYGVNSSEFPKEIK